MIAVWGPAGAPGRTTVATGAGRRPGQPGQDHAGRRRPLRRQRRPGARRARRGLRTARRQPGWPAAGMLEERFASVQRAFDEQLTVVTGLPRPDRWTEVRPGTVELLARDRGRHGHVVVDTGFSLERRRPQRPPGPQPAHPGRARGRRRGRWSSAPPTRSACPGWPGRWSSCASGAPCRPGLVVNRMRPTLGWSRARRRPDGLGLRPSGRPALPPRGPRHGRPGPGHRPHAARDQRREPARGRDRHARRRGRPGPVQSRPSRVLRRRTAGTTHPR